MSRVSLSFLLHQKGQPLLQHPGLGRGGSPEVRAVGVPPNPTRLPISMPLLVPSPQVSTCFQLFS